MARKRRANKITDEGLKAILQAARANAEGESQGSDLAAQRSDAMDYYMGRMDKDLPSMEGRSSAVSTDVQDTVEGIMPSLLDIFAGSENVCQFNPVGPEDEDAARQETDYVNHVYNQENQGFLVTHQMIKDCLLQKNGIVKFWWEESETEERETYEGLDEAALGTLMDDDQVELIERTERPYLAAPNSNIIPIGVSPGVEAPTQNLYDVTVIRRKPYGCVKVAGVPPEEFLISKRARNIPDSPYCGHVTPVTRSSLIEEGYSKDLVSSIPTGSPTPSTEQTSRATVSDDDQGEAAAADWSMEEVEKVEHYIRVDWDGDGIAELRKITTAGTGYTILDNEPYDSMPFASATPIIMSHRFWGRSMADLTMDIQKIKTAIIRTILDNLYFANNGRLEIAEEFAGENTLDDLLTNRPGGIVRTKRPGGLLPVPHTSIGPHAYPALEYFDGVREVRTGITKNTVGPDSDAINPYKGTATGVNALMTAAQQKIRMIARIIAETGFRDMMLGIHELILKHGKDARKVQLGNKWVDIDPRQWKTRKDMTVTVGLGTGSRDQVLSFLMQILNLQIKALEIQGGASGPLVFLKDIYSSLKKFTEAGGYKVDQFFSEPTPEDQQKAAQPKPDPKMAEAQGKLQLQQQKNQGDMMAKQQQAQQDAYMEKYKADLKAETDSMKAKIDAQVKLMTAAIEAKLKVMYPDVRMGGEVG